MLSAISNTSPLLYLHRIGTLDWLSKLFDDDWVPQAVRDELIIGQKRGVGVPILNGLIWIHSIEPKSTPSEWLALDLGPGEIAAMALALENPDRIMLLDDMLARRIAQAAGLKVWGTLKVLLEAKSQGITDEVKPLLHQLTNAECGFPPK